MEREADSSSLLTILSGNGRRTERHEIRRTKIASGAAEVGKRKEKDAEKDREIRKHLVVYAD